MNMDIKTRLDLSNFRAFMIGALSALLIVVIILLSFWSVWALPWLHGVAYNMQLDESALRAMGIVPTSNYDGMFRQVKGFNSRLDYCADQIVCNAVVGQ
jgi:hypothetical protein